MEFSFISAVQLAAFFILANQVVLVVFYCMRISEANRMELELRELREAARREADELQRSVIEAYRRCARLHEDSPEAAEPPAIPADLTPIPLGDGQRLVFDAEGWFEIREEAT